MNTESIINFAKGGLLALGTIAMCAAVVAALIAAMWLFAAVGFVM